MPFILWQKPTTLSPVISTSIQLASQGLVATEIIAIWPSPKVSGQNKQDSNRIFTVYYNVIPTTISLSLTALKQIH